MEIKKGETLALVGNSGGGKQRWLTCLQGFMVIDAEKF